VPAADPARWRRAPAFPLGKAPELRLEGESREWRIDPVELRRFAELRGREMDYFLRGND